LYLIAKKLGLLASKAKAGPPGKSLRWSRKMRVPGIANQIFAQYLPAKGPLIGALRSVKQPDAKAFQPGPVDFARKPLQAALGHCADRYAPFIRLKESYDQIQFGFARLSAHVRCANPLALQLEIDPWDEEEVPRSCLNRAGSRNQPIRPRIPHPSKPQLVASITDREQIDHIQRPPPVTLTRVKPFK